MWSTLQEKLVEWFGIVLNTKFASPIDELILDSTIWRDLLAVLDPSIKIQGRSNEEQFETIFNFTPQHIPVPALNTENKAALLELLLRLVWKYHVPNVDTLKEPLLSWTTELINSFPYANVTSWPASVRIDEHLGPLLAGRTSQVSLEKNQSYVVQSIQKEAATALTEELRNVVDEAFARRTLTGAVTADDQKAIFKLGQRKLVRLFTSSTFTDTKLERDMLMAEAYPFLRSICQMFGYGFEVVDMRWGIREHSSDSHGTSELCLTELRKCLTRSTGPAFVTFLGNKYGFRPFPKFIEPRVLAKLWENMKAAEVNKAQKKLQGNRGVPFGLFQKLRELPLDLVWSEIERSKAAAVFVENELLLIPVWYRLDSNRVPPVYTLQSIWTILPDKNSPDQARQRVAGDKWWAMFLEMQNLFRANVVCLSKAERAPFVISITEEEVRNGILENPNFKSQSFCVLRDISDLATFASDETQVLKRFVDLGTDDKIDKEAAKLLQVLKREVSSVVPPARALTYNVEGKQVAKTLEGIDQTQQYLNKFSDDFIKLIASHILDGIRESFVSIEPVVEEVIQHYILQESKLKAFIERSSVMASTYDYLDKPAQHPLIIYGQSGSGKTFCVAGAIQRALSMTKETNVVYRYLGTTPKSSNLRALLQSLCQQLAHIAGETIIESSIIMELTALFISLLAKAAAVKPLFVFLDSLDQLTGDGTSNFDWIPRGGLPSNVHLVISVYSELLPSLTTAVPDHSLVHITELEANEGAAILDKWLATSHRALTQSQRDLILTRFKVCPLPLYLKLCFDVSLRWNSYTPMSECVLAADVKGLVNQIFERLEIVHGKKLVSVALGCITASKEGLSYPELEDILACSEQVLESVYQWWTPPLRRIPPLIWLRVNDELDGYLVERSSGDNAVYGWYHRQFAEAAREHYLSNSVEKSEYHRLMALYFGGVLDGDVPKPFIDAKGVLAEAPRFTQPQPLSFNNKTYNTRKLIELPYHHSLSGLTRRYEDSLFNFDFIHAKCAAGLIYVLAADYEDALAAIGDKDKVLAGRLAEFQLFIKQNFSSLVEYPTSAIQFAAFQSSQLFPTQQAIRLSKKLPVVLWRNKKDIDNPVRMTLPHDAWVTAAAVSKDCTSIATVDSGNKNILIWDFASGQMLTCLQGHNAWVNQLHFLPDSRTLLSLSVDRKLMMWNTKSAVLVHTFDGSFNPRWTKLDSSFGFTVSSDGKFAASGYGNIVEVWDLQKPAEVANFIVTPPSFRSWDDDDVKVIFSPNDSNVLATSIWNDSTSRSTVGVWNVTQAIQTHEVQLEDSEKAVWITFDEQGDSLHVATEHGRFFEWVSFGKLEVVPPTPKFQEWKVAKVKSEEVSHDGKFLLVKDEHQLAIVDKAISERVKANPARSYRILRAVMSSYGNKAAMLCSDNTLRVINGRTADSLFELPIQAMEICYPDVAFENEDTMKVAVGVQSEVEIRVLSAINGKEAKPPASLRLSTSPDSVKLSASGRYVIVSTRNGYKYDVNVYTSDLKHQHTFTSPDDRFSVTFSSDDTAMAYAQGMNLQTFNTQTFECVQTFHPQHSFVGSYALSNDLKHLVMLRDSELLIYNITDGSKISTSTSISSSYYFGFSQSGEYIITYNKGYKGADVISRVTGSRVRHVRIERGIEILLISGSSGLCRDIDGNIYLLDVDF